MVRGNGAPVSTTWQGLHKKPSFPRLLFRNTHAFDMEPFTAFYAPSPKNSAAVFTTSLSGAELIDSSLGHFFRATDLWLHALHTTRDTMLILKGETEQLKTRKWTNKKKPGWGFLKASKIESLRLLKKIELNYIIGIISPGCDVPSAQVLRQTNKTESEMLSSCLTFKS